MTTAQDEGLNQDKSIQEVTAEAFTDNFPQLIKNINWMVKYSTEPNANSTLAFKEKFEGSMRGVLFEKVCMEISPDMCQTIYPPHGKGAIEGLTMKTFNDITRGVSKENHIEWTVKKSITEEPLSISSMDRDALKQFFDVQLSEEMLQKFSKDEIREKEDEKIKEAGRQYEQDIIQGYGSGDIKGKDKKYIKGTSGIFFGESVIPDGALVDRNGEIKGLVEVKAYLPYEMKAFVEYLENLPEEVTERTQAKNLLIRTPEGKEQSLNLGVDAKGEMEFIDNFRAAGFGQPALRETMPILLRFPSDMPNDLLERYGIQLEKSGITNVVIQKLPISTDEMAEISMALLKDTLQEELNGPMQDSEKVGSRPLRDLRNQHIKTLCTMANVKYIEPAIQASNKK